MKDDTIKITDMGISKSIVGSCQILQVGKIGTPLYTSPEVLKRQPFDFKVDMWALGCLLYYMACLEPPFSVPASVDYKNRPVNDEEKKIVK